MQKKLFVLLLLVACVALSGCALVVKDPVRDASQVIVDVNGETIDKATITQLAADYRNNMLNYYYQMYSMYGLSFNADSIDTSGAEQEVIDNQVERLVLKQKLASMPELALTEEDEAEILEHGQEHYDEQIELVKTQYLKDSEKEGDELTKEAQEYALTLDSRLTLDYFVEEARTEKIAEKMKAYAIKDVAVTEEELKTEYESRVASAKEDYANNLSAFGEAVNAGNAVFYRPAGYRYVKQVLVGYPAETQTALTEATSAMNTAQTAVNTAQSTLDKNVEDLAAEGITDEEKATLEATQADLQKALDDAKADLAEKTEARAKLLEEAKAAIQPTVDEVMAKIAAGEDFEALIEKYNTDPGMQNEPGKTNGYAVCEGYTPFEAAFVEAAMALEKVGDTSQPVASDNYGFYIIRYQSDIEEGEVPLEDVRAEIEPTLLTNKQDTTYDAAKEQWTKDANVKTYIERLSN